MVLIFVLLVVFQVKHFLADYIFQNEYMLGKFKEVGWEHPLTAHCLVHAAFTIIALMFVVDVDIAVTLALVDFGIHFAIDRGKVLLSKGLDSGKDAKFWWYLGVDQLLHHLTHYAFIGFVVYIQ